MEATYLLSQKGINGRNFDEIKKLFKDISGTVNDIKFKLEQDVLEQTQLQSLKEQKAQKQIEKNNLRLSRINS